MSMSELLHIAEQFQFPGDIDHISPYGSGIINDTFLVTFSNPAPSAHPRTGKRAILQRINQQVFPQPIQVMHNLGVIVQHVAQQTSSKQSVHEFLLPSLYTTHEGTTYVQEQNGGIWRAMAFIEDTDSFDVLASLEQAFEVGVALGTFHQRLSDLPVDQLYDTLPGFHITPGYLKQYDEVSKTQSQQVIDSAEQLFCQDIIESNRDLAGVLVNAKPTLSMRIMHGDPKLNNVLFDRKTGKAVSIIDLDTVKPGLVHYDIADCLRSCCNRSGELPEPGTNVEFDITVCQSILNGYSSSGLSFLESRDFEFLIKAIMLLPFELGIRFYTDYLQGNRYFKIMSPLDNLARAVTQFKLLLSIQNQADEIQKIIREIKIKAGC
ncbi:phosphotransferase enzyme family protein [Kaarinaea lacus]